MGLLVSSLPCCWDWWTGRVCQEQVRLVLIMISQFEQDTPGQRISFARKTATVVSFGKEFIRIRHNFFKASNGFLFPQGR